MVESLPVWFVAPLSVFLAAVFLYQIRAELREWLGIKGKK